VAFQLTFAIITVALITGSAADRWRFGGFIAFTGAWSLLVYAPVAHWVFSPAGWLYHRGVEDFAGGTVVEANAGIAGLAVAIVLGRRHGWPGANFRPHNLPLVMIGTGLLWFGWFGFNAGSAYGANRLAAYAFLNTNTAGAAAVITWLIVEKRRDGHPTTLGAASGAVAGLVAITPSCGYVTPMGALAIGAVAGMACAFATPLKLRLRFDDSLDVVAVHFVGGIVGTLAVGVLGDSHISGRDGLLRGGGFGLLGNQALALGATIVYSGIVTALIAWVIHRVRPMRLSPEEQQEGMDAVLHSETAYENSALPAMLGFGSQLHSAGTNPVNRGAQEVR
jgi:Amt family ammonium transporter